jgi:hypothetical protein
MDVLFFPQFPHFRPRFRPRDKVEPHLQTSAFASLLADFATLLLAKWLLWGHGAPVNLAAQVAVSREFSFSSTPALVPLSSSRHRSKLSMGASFKVHQPMKFSNNVMPACACFSNMSTKHQSFRCQFNRCEFGRTDYGDHTESHSHKQFPRDLGHEVTSAIARLKKGVCPPPTRRSHCFKKNSLSSWSVVREFQACEDFDDDILNNILVERLFQSMINLDNAKRGKERMGIVSVETLFLYVVASVPVRVSVKVNKKDEF